MNILKMKYFVDAARLENISRAAQINYVSQTAVSQQITSIEKELGIKLFFREKGRVRLTPAGVSFFNDCQEILTTYDQAVSKAKNIYNTQYGRGNILLGFSPASTIAYIDEVIAEFNRYYPDVSVKLLERNYAELRREMVDDTLHMAIAPDFIMEEIKGTESLFLAREEIGFLVPRRNPLAKNDTITIEEIKNEKIIMIGLESAGRAYDGMLAKRAQEGIIPVVAEVVRSAGLQTMLVAMGRGCAYLPERLALYDRRNCKMLKIADSNDHFNLSVTWKVDEANHPLNLFVRLLTKFFEERFEQWVAENLTEV